MMYDWQVLSARRFIAGQPFADDWDAQPKPTETFIALYGAVGSMAGLAVCNWLRPVNPPSAQFSSALVSAMSNCVLVSEPATVIVCDSRGAQGSP